MLLSYIYYLFEYSSALCYRISDIRHLPDMSDMELFKQHKRGEKMETTVERRMSIGETIRQFRVKSGLTQKDLAAKVGLTQQAISLIESGNRRIDVELFIQLLAVFDERLDQYLKDSITNVDFQKLNAYYNEIQSGSPASLNARLVQAFNQLNNSGKKKALEQMELLSRIDEFKTES